MWLGSQLISLMTFKKEQSYKHSFMAAFLSVLIRIVFLPVWLVVAILYQAHVILSSRKLRVSATALSPMTMRWLQHQLGFRLAHRGDDVAVACGKKFCGGPADAGRTAGDENGFHGS